jgi:hypothetical protein
VPHSGSFIRPSASISTGVPFLAALRSKYLANSDAERYATDFGREIEVVGLDKVRERMRDLANLGVVGLEGECVCGAGEKHADEIAFVCPSKFWTTCV